MTIRVPTETIDAIHDCSDGIFITHLKTMKPYIMTSEAWDLAEKVARQLMDYETPTDVNEVEKIAAFARTRDDSGTVFALNTALTDSRRNFIRSQRTIRYFENIEDVLNDRLSQYQTATGEQAQELAAILGWAARLMRYYDSDEGILEFNVRQKSDPLTQPAVQMVVEAPPVAKHVPPPVAKHVPKVETKREWVTIAGAVNGGKATVNTEAVAGVPCKDIPYFQPSPRFKADVVYEDAIPIRAAFKGWK